MDTISELSACLALVRPAGMTEDMATEWLTVAASSLGDLNEREVRKGCERARAECTHHGQIIPTIRKANADILEYRRKAAALTWDQREQAAPRLGHSGAKQISHLKLIEKVEHD